MMKLRMGDMVKTNYGTGPYRIRYIKRNCTCPDYLDDINAGCGKAPPRKPHIHLTCTNPDGNGSFWLGGYDEVTLIHCNGRDHLTILQRDSPVQLTLF